MAKTPSAAISATSLTAKTKKRDVLPTEVKQVAAKAGAVVLILADGTEWVSPLGLDMTKSWWKQKTTDNNAGHFNRTPKFERG